MPGGRQIAALLCAALLCAALGSGCGGDESSASTSEVRLEADPGGALAYIPDEVSAKAGPVTIAFKNPQSVGHVVEVENSKGWVVTETVLVIEESTSITQRMKPGRYTFYCSVPGYRKAGMEGTLTVE